MVDELAIRMQARQFMSGLDLSSIHSDLSVYTKKVNAKLRAEELGEGESGYTLTKRDGTSSIVVNELERKERQRFSICHEVAHLVLGLTSDHREVPSWGYAKRDDNEIACDIFASEMLMPFESFKRDVDRAEPSLELIERLRAEYVVSFSACGSRLAAVTDYPCAFVFMDSKIVRYASRSKSLRDLKAWIELKAPIPTSSVARQLIEDGYRSGKDASISQDVWFRDWPNGYELTEVAKHSPEFDETFSLIWFDPDTGPEESVNNWSGVPERDDDEGLKELDGLLSFSGKRRRR
jgi:Zn-dependent peptidase ImmA (M78 family)